MNMAARLEELSKEKGHELYRQGIEKFNRYMTRV
jgi:hypothetical protein